MRRNLIAVWQQDRWSNGGAQGLPHRRLVRPRRAPGGDRPRRRSRAARAAIAANGGDYERASDPWVSIGPDGSAHQIALAINDSNPTSAILVSSSRDGGRSWGRITTLQTDTTAELFNDKESITADPRQCALRLRGLGSPADPGSRRPGFAVLRRHAVRALDRRRADVGADANDPRLPGQQQRPDARQPDRRARQRRAGQRVQPDRQRLAAGGGAALDRPWRDLVGADRSSTCSSAAPHKAKASSIPPTAIRCAPATCSRRPPPTRGEVRNDLHIVWQDIRFTLAAPLPYFNDQIVHRRLDGRRPDLERPAAGEREQADAGVHRLRRGQRPRARSAVTYYDFTADDPSGEHARHRLLGHERRATRARRSRRASGSRRGRSTCGPRPTPTDSSSATTKA